MVKKPISDVTPSIGNNNTTYISNTNNGTRTHIQVDQVDEDIIYHGPKENLNVNTPPKTPKKKNKIHAYVEVWNDTKEKQSKFNIGGPYNPNCKFNISGGGTIGCIGDNNNVVMNETKIKKV